MFFEMRFDLGTLDLGEQSLPFGLLVNIIFYDGTCTNHNAYFILFLDVRVTKGDIKTYNSAKHFLMKIMYVKIILKFWMKSICPHYNSTT